MQAVILAGGKGARLKPFTANIPKPLVPLDDLPIIEYVLRQLKHFGWTDIVIAVNHLADLMMAVIGDGSKLGLNITYSLEDSFLGTAGPLSLIDSLEEDFLVMNGDLLTTIDFKDLYEFHLQQKPVATVAVYKKEIKIDLGVLKIESDEIVDYIEKPTYHFDVSTGIYVFNRKVLEYIPRNEYLDLPELIMALKDKKESLKCYCRDYYWLDIGRVADYDTASEIINQRKDEFYYDV